MLLRIHMFSISCSEAVVRPASTASNDTERSLEVKKYMSWRSVFPNLEKSLSTTFTASIANLSPPRFFLPLSSAPFKLWLSGPTRMVSDSPDTLATKSQSILSRRKQAHRRNPRACNECRSKKRKCDGSQPCRACAQSNLGRSWEASQTGLCFQF